MSRISLLLMGLILAGAGCVVAPASNVPGASKPEIVFPVEHYASGRTFKLFGEYLAGRFTGFHVGDDVEAADVAAEVPVVAMGNGIVRRVEWVEGYGGLVTIDHNRGVTALYGHMDLGSVSLTAGDTVEVGRFIGNLGDDRSSETDGERKHLHFALRPSAYDTIVGYEPNVEGVEMWINPTDFFASHGLNSVSPARVYDPTKDLGGDVFRLVFTIPAGWDVEYVPQIESLNLFTLSGSGSARDRSRMFIRYFDAADFLTLPTVTIHSSNDLTVGKDEYVARRYDIEKKSGIADFAYQPRWRNLRHVVTDFRAEEGRTRYYVVAGSPELDEGIYEEILASMEIQ